MSLCPAPSTGDGGGKGEENEASSLVLERLNTLKPLRKARRKPRLYFLPIIKSFRVAAAAPV